MIKTQIYGPRPVFHQTDNTYSLPSCTGSVQWNGNTKKFQVSTGGGWTDIDNSITLNMDPVFGNIIQWVEKKMKEESELEELAKSNATIADLYQQLKEKEKQISMVKTLLKNSNDTPQITYDMGGPIFLFSNEAR